MRHLAGPRRIDNAHVPEVGSEGFESCESSVFLVACFTSLADAFP
jgi:hypothetical protein